MESLLLKPSIFLNLVKKVGLEIAKIMINPMGSTTKIPNEPHLKAIKRVLRYVNVTIKYGIWFTKDSTAPFAPGCIGDKKSTYGGRFFIDNNLVSWCSKKQNSISLSMAKAKYIVAGSCSAQLIWMKQMLEDCGITQDTLVVYCDIPA